MKLKGLLTIALLFVAGMTFSQSQHLLFFERSTGSADMHNIAYHGGLGAKFSSVIRGWRTTWTDIEYYRAGDLAP
jgi:hypothetical protein